MSFVQTLQSATSSRTFPADRPREIDTEGHRPLRVRIDLDRLSRERPNLEWYRPDRDDMWRFGALLPLDPDLTRERSSITPLGEGRTPRETYSDHPLARRHGFELAIKDEGGLDPGSAENPTQSFKDRGLAMTVSLARHHGIDRLVIPTQGNAGDALAEYAVAGGLEAVVIMPESTPLPILGKVAAYDRLHENIHLETVAGTIAEAGERMERAFLPDGYFNVATFQEPGWRIEGKKTMGLELAEPDEPGGAWSLPDVIVYPTGGGTGLLGMWKAFEELDELGLVNGERPRMVAVQSAATAPVVRAFESGVDDPDPDRVQPGSTVATGLNVASSPGHREVLDILHRSGGSAVAVPESEIEAALRAAFHDRGWWVCPETAACLAALETLVERETIREGDEVVVFNTASLEKYLPAVRHLI